MMCRRKLVRQIVVWIQTQEGQLAPKDPFVFGDTFALVDYTAYGERWIAAFDRVTGERRSNWRFNTTP